MKNVTMWKLSFSKILCFQFLRCHKFAKENSFPTFCIDINVIKATNISRNGVVNTKLVIKLERSQTQAS